jgi:hypothetical protein
MITSNSAGHLKYVGACDQYDERIATSWSLVTDYSALIMIVQENVNHVHNVTVCPHGKCKIRAGTNLIS